MPTHSRAPCRFVLASSDAECGKANLSYVGHTPRSQGIADSSEFDLLPTLCRHVDADRDGSAVAATLESLIKVWRTGSLLLNTPPPLPPSPSPQPCAFLRPLLPASPFPACVAPSLEERPPQCCRSWPHYIGANAALPSPRHAQYIAEHGRARDVVLVLSEQLSSFLSEAPLQHEQDDADDEEGYGGLHGC